MASFQQFTIIGNATRDPQFKNLPSGGGVCEFGMASNRKFTSNGQQKEDVLFIDCTAFGKQAETLNTYVKKGKPLFAQGRLRLDQWEDKNGGGKRSKISMVIDSFQFIGNKESAEGGDDEINF